MGQKRAQKKEKIEEFKNLLEKGKSLVFVDYRGLSADEIKELKEKLREHNSEFKVFKKTLAEIAFKEKGISFNRKDWEGQMAFVFGFDDEIIPFKLAQEFSKNNENLKILGGFLDGEIILRDQAISLAQLPSREELFAKIVSSISAPLYNFQHILSGNIKGLIYSLRAIASK